MSAPVGMDDDDAGVVLCQVVPFDVSRLPLLPGATKLGVLVPLPKITLFAVSVVSPVPPLATLTVAKVVVIAVVPDPVTSPDNVMD
jgi:hypothetical protein